MVEMHLRSIKEVVVDLALNVFELERRTVLHAVTAEPRTLGEIVLGCRPMLHHKRVKSILEHLLCEQTIFELPFDQMWATVDYCAVSGSFDAAAASQARADVAKALVPCAIDTSKSPPRETPDVTPSDPFADIPDDWRPDFDNEH